MNEENALQNQILGAPKEIRAFLAHGNWAVVTKEIAQKNNFSPEQATTFENEVLFVLLGLELKQDLQKNIQNELQVPELLAHDITSEVFEKILKEVEDFLPTQTEESELPSGQGLLEDSAGNADNVITAKPSPALPISPSTPREEKWWEKPAQPQVAPDTVKEVTSNSAAQVTVAPPAAKEPLDILHAQTGQTILEEKLSKIGSGTENRVVEKQYGSQDPYREPIN